MGSLSNLVPTIWTHLKKSLKFIFGKLLKPSDDRYVLMQIDTPSKMPTRSWMLPQSLGMISEPSMVLIKEYLENKYAGRAISEELRNVMAADGDSILCDLGFNHLRMSVKTEFNTANINFHYR